jgi:hypothetical protein
MPLANFGWIGNKPVINQDIAVTPKLLETIIYDATVKRYRFIDGKRFVSKSVVLDLIDRKIQTEKERLKSLAERIQKQEIGVYKDVGQTLKNIHLLELAKAKNGFENITNSDLGILGNTLKQQYYQGVNKDTGEPFGLKYLIKDAPTQSIAQIENRLSMYGDSGEVTGNKVKESDSLLNGDTSSMRTLGATDMHCRECLLYASLGWQPIGVLPVPKTQCTCRSNCKCSIFYR